ncbi:hypothetical protein M413DRAFT_447424 [Hebeloma cylindrosporum]|uniref:Uncharacterized protein n=1 Tax=Hebeloma cylindrosporum TaxID=76867 RepID=A0A0C3BQZ7_HEBCY|nr:hypothetical protein M413DRAFT_447424 [Hebeloma cylindrosporum h7]
MTAAENHPFSALSRQIDQFLWASILLASAVTAISLINMGRLSVFTAPSMFLITVAHHIIFLRLASRDRKKPTHALEGTLAPTASKANIILLWILIAFWVIVVMIIIIVSVLVMSSMNQYEGWERLAGYLEIPFVVAEIALLIVLALKCRKQRRRTIVIPANVDWQHFRPAATTQAHGVEARNFVFGQRVNLLELEALVPPFHPQGSTTTIYDAALETEAILKSQCPADLRFKSIRTIHPT